MCPKICPHPFIYSLHKRLFLYLFPGSVALFPLYKRGRGKKCLQSRVMKRDKFESRHTHGIFPSQIVNFLSPRSREKKKKGMYRTVCGNIMNLIRGGGGFFVKRKYKMRENSWTWPRIRISKERQRKKHNICFEHIFYIIRAPQITPISHAFHYHHHLLFPCVLFIFFFRFCSPPPLYCHVMMDKCNKTQRGIQKTKTLYFPSFFFLFCSFFCGEEKYCCWCCCRFNWIWTI